MDESSHCTDTAANMMVDAEPDPSPSFARFHGTTSTSEGVVYLNVRHALATVNEAAFGLVSKVHIYNKYHDK